jgi:hypothetical protein
MFVIVRNRLAIEIRDAVNSEYYKIKALGCLAVRASDSVFTKQWDVFRVRIVGFCSIVVWK